MSISNQKGANLWLKCTKNVWLPGSASTRWGNLCTPQTPLAAIRGATLDKTRQEKGGRENGKGLLREGSEEGEGRKGRGPTYKGGRRKRRKRTKGRGWESPESQGEQNKTLCEWVGVTGLT